MIMMLLLLLLQDIAILRAGSFRSAITVQVKWDGASDCTERKTNCENIIILRTHIYIIYRVYNIIHIT